MWSERHTLSARILVQDLSSVHYIICIVDMINQSTNLYFSGNQSWFLMRTVHCWNKSSRESWVRGTSGSRLAEFGKSTVHSRSLPSLQIFVSSLLIWLVRAHTHFSKTTYQNTQRWMKEVVGNERGCCEGAEENWWEMIDLTCLEIIPLPIYSPPPPHVLP